MINKRLIAILGVLAFLIVLIIINSTLFTLQKVNINWLTSKYQLEAIEDSEITEDIEMGQSIFLLKKDDIASQLEKSYPYLKVVSLETKFPNKLVIHGAERESLYAIKLSTSEYAILDEVGKVLDIKNGSIFEGSEADLGTRPIRLNFQSMSVKVEDFVEGTQVRSEYIANLLSSLSLSLRESSYSPTTSKGVISYIDIVYQGSSSEISIKTRNGMTLKISQIENFTTEKLLFAFERYNYLHNQGFVDCTIEVWYSSEKNQILADIQI